MDFESIDQCGRHVTRKFLVILHKLHCTNRTSHVSLEDNLMLRE